MDTNVHLCSAVECTAAHPRLTKSPEEEKSLYVFSVSVLLLSSVVRFGISRMQDFYYIHVIIHMEKRVKAMSAHRLIQRTLPNGYLWRHISQPLNQLVEEVVITATL